jgi:acyl-CoA thioester hydrolase
MKTMQEELKTFPAQVRVDVQWGEMDLAGHVNNVIYLKWFEHARVAYMDHLSYPIVIEPGREDLPGVILAKLDCKYLLPMEYPDTVILGIKVTELQEDRFTMHCKMFSQRHERLAAIANAVMVTFDYHHRRKASLPKSLREGIERLEATIEP